MPLPPNGSIFKPARKRPADRGGNVQGDTKRARVLQLLQQDRNRPAAAAREAYLRERMGLPAAPSRESGE